MVHVEVELEVARMAVSMVEQNTSTYVLCVHADQVVCRGLFTLSMVGHNSR